jgi:hypothetical protein
MINDPWTVFGMAAIAVGVAGFFIAIVGLTVERQRRKNALKTPITTIDWPENNADDYKRTRKTSTYLSGDRAGDRIL